MSARKGSTDSKHYYKWLSKAASDMRSAGILRAYGGDAEAVAFHCQQTIEKALKGYLLYKTGRHYDGHNLTFLCRQAARLDKRFYDYLDESALLNHYYIESRYPTDLPFVIDKKEIDTIYGIAERMFSVIKQEIYEDDSPATIERK